MSFRRRNDAERQHGEEKNWRDNQRGWYLNENYARWGKVSANFSFLIVLLVVIIYNFSVTIRESVVENMIQVSAALSAFCLALPLFLKDFQAKRTYWKSFLVLSTIFMVCCTVGIAALIYDVFPANASGTIALVLIVFLLSIVTGKTALSHPDKQERNERRRAVYVSVSISPNEFIEIVLTFALIIYCVTFSSNLSAALIILSSYAFFVLFAIFLSILLGVLFARDDKSLDATEMKNLKWSIQQVLETSPEKAYSDIELVDTLRRGPYKGRMGMISIERVRDAVAEMDYEQLIDRPHATIHNWEFVVPRWNDRYEEIIFNESLILFIESWSYNNINLKTWENRGAGIAARFGLSKQLLESANIPNRIVEKFPDSWGDGNRIHFDRVKLARFQLSSGAELREQLTDLLDQLENSIWYSALTYESQQRPLLLKFLLSEVLKIDPKILIQQGVLTKERYSDEYKLSQED
jgi:hypothetical protein